VKGLFAEAYALPRKGVCWADAEYAADCHGFVESYLRNIFDMILDLCFDMQPCISELFVL